MTKGSAENGRSFQQQGAVKASVLQRSLDKQVGSEALTGEVPRQLLL